MKKPVKYILGGILAMLGFSSCTALYESRVERAEKMQEETKAAVYEHLDMTVGAERRAMEADRANLEAARRKHVLDSIRRAEEERRVLLYAVPNVPFQQIKEQ